ncbi:hypothetical protein NKH98_12345 [Mesorhizobium sp. M0833]|uniref:hypothetical protein n=1 Tax=Mesorhizobium sp. M0833 TaxID=2957009 RepID=UPI0033369776
MKTKPPPRNDDHRLVVAATINPPNGNIGEAGTKRFAFIAAVGQKLSAMNDAAMVDTANAAAGKGPPKAVARQRPPAISSTDPAARRGLGAGSPARPGTLQSPGI